MVPLNSINRRLISFLWNSISCSRYFWEIGKIFSILSFIKNVPSGITAPIANSSFDSCLIFLETMTSSSHSKWDAITLASTIPPLGIAKTIRSLFEKVTFFCSYFKVIFYNLKVITKNLRRYHIKIISIGLPQYNTYNFSRYNGDIIMRMLQ